MNFYDVKTAIIVARSNNHVIGKNGDLPFRLSSDLKNFKALTLNKVIIMGRKTFQSLPKLLPNRTHIVISRDINFKANGAFLYSNLKLALNCAKSMAFENGQQEVFVIGGGEIYTQAIEFTDIIYETVVNCEIEGDTFFPLLPSEKWHEINRQSFSKNDKDEYNFEIITHKKQQKA